MMKCNITWSTDERLYQSIGARRKLDEINEVGCYLGVVAYFK